LWRNPLPQYNSKRKRRVDGGSYLTKNRTQRLPKTEPTGKRGDLHRRKQRETGYLTTAKEGNFHPRLTKGWSRNLDDGVPEGNTLLGGDTTTEHETTTLTPLSTSILRPPEEEKGSRTHTALKSKGAKETRGTTRLKKNRKAFHAFTKELQPWRKN